MSSPTKDTDGSDAVSKLAELKPGDSKLLILSSICMVGKIDSEKLVRLAAVKKTSANANYHRAKKHLAELLDEQPTIEGGAGSKHGIPNASPTKPSATKRRKTTKQGVSDAENSDAPIKHDESPEPAADVVKEESDD